MLDWICDRLGHPMDNLGMRHGYVIDVCHCGIWISSEEFFFTSPTSERFTPKPWMKGR